MLDIHDHTVGELSKLFYEPGLSVVQTEIPPEVASPMYCEWGQPYL